MDPLDRMPSGEGGAKPRRVLHGWKISAFALVMLTLIAGGFYAGTLFQRPEDSALANIDTFVPVTATVEMRSVEEPLALAGSIVRGETIALGTSGPEGSAVVTDIAVQEGNLVSPGSYLGAVSGRPVIVLGSGVPLYRDLKYDDLGLDVERLQAALVDMGYLGVVPTGRVDAVTLEAIRLVYVNVGLDAPGKDKTDTVFRWQDFVQIPGNAGKVSSISAVAAPVTPEEPLVRIQTHENVITARARLLDADRLPQGTVVTLQGGQEITESNVISVGEFLPEDPKAILPAGKDIIIKLPSSFENLAPGEQIQISLPSSGRKEIAVPLIAVRQDDEGPYVEIAESSAKDSSENHTAPRRIAIDVKEQASGWVAIEENPELVPGTLISVP